MVGGGGGLSSHLALLEVGGSEGGGLAGPPLLLWSPSGPRRRLAENFDAKFLAAPKAPHQNFGYRPQTLEREQGGGGVHRGATPRYGIQMRVHDWHCSDQSWSAKQKSKKEALQ